MTRILVIKHGALGDFVQAFAPFHSIRQHWPEARITLLTTAPFCEMARRSPWFDRIESDSRPRWWDLPGLFSLRARLRGYDLVIDLQTSRRSTRYYRLASTTAWSGLARRSAFRHDNPWRNAMHSVARQRDQLARLGVPEAGAPDLRWLSAGAPVGDRPYAVLVPGAAPHRPAKRWPAGQYGALAAILHEYGLDVLIVGSAAERSLAETIRSICPQAQDLTGRTDLMELGSVFAGARLAIGNDTGPMHLAASLGCRAIVLFSAESDPRLTAPVGLGPGQVSVLVQEDLRDLDVSRVAALVNRGH
ncbi:glycosyltransferase family 9 protein [Swaminathania salitolerans]|uniref:Glycosyl transferase n=1 Tax=Swaminathania salitolerans TaxID=182838 RepID=A0A511BSE8_9PROT|nr:glycosyltransferase family 9 protein [Swaminathania salitolerans]GBQ13278.1 lipopolysaccharide heptosyltransferase [Swaminathania salitolerans LMG 21291]GEL03266.1 glycosyl transferase [Swaminathania salitolerans]